MQCQLAKPDEPDPDRVAYQQLLRAERGQEQLGRLETREDCQPPGDS